MFLSVSCKFSILNYLPSFLNLFIYCLSSISSYFRLSFHLLGFFLLLYRYSLSFFLLRKPRYDPISVLTSYHDVPNEELKLGSSVLRSRKSDWNHCAVYVILFFSEREPPGKLKLNFGIERYRVEFNVARVLVTCLTMIHVDLYMYCNGFIENDGWIRTRSFFRIETSLVDTTVRIKYLKDMSWCVYMKKIQKFALTFSITLKK